MEKILLGGSHEKVYLYSNMLNRHGVIAGATGTGKTVTLKVIAEQLSDLGIPVFLADVKGDLAGLASPGEMNEKLLERIEKIGIEGFDFDEYPVEFWDVFGERGLPVRATISEMGPVMLSRLLGLNDIQSGVMNIAFKVADENGLLLLDLKDLKAILNYVNDHSKELQREYGNISSASVGAILRSLLLLENEGADNFFAEPALDIKDFFKTSGAKGVINILAAEKLFNSPKLYSTFLLWMLSELYEELPEVGDLDMPKFVFFFDEAHLIFADCPKPLLEKIELIIRLIRSKGVGVFFITQNPTDIPDSVAAQLGNRIQHALRAYTPKEIKVIKAVAETFRQGEGQDIEKEIMELSVGEALISTLDEKGIPTFVQKVLVCPPKSSFGTIEAARRAQIINSSPFYEKYSEIIDSESAYELLELAAKRSELQADENLKEDELTKRQAELEKKEKELLEKERKKTTTRRTDSNFDRFTKNMMSTVGREFGRVIFRGIFGNARK